MWLHCTRRHLVFEGGQQLFEVVEFPRVEQQFGFKLVRTDGGVLLAQLVQLKVRHHFHVFLDQSSVRIKVSWLLWEERVLNLPNDTEEISQTAEWVKRGGREKREKQGQKKKN